MTVSSGWVDAQWFMVLAKEERLLHLTTVEGRHHPPSASLQKHGTYSAVPLHSSIQ